MRQRRRDRVEIKSRGAQAARIAPSPRGFVPGYDPSWAVDEGDAVALFLAALDGVRQQIAALEADVAGLHRVMGRRGAGDVG